MITKQQSRQVYFFFEITLKSNTVYILSKNRHQSSAFYYSTSTPPLKILNSGKVTVNKEREKGIWSEIFMNA